MNERLQALQQHWQALPPVPRLIVGTLVAILLLSVFRPTAEEVPETDLAPRVSTETVRTAAFPPQLLLFGRIESPASATLSSSVTALVAETPLLPGDRVEQGDLILALDPREATLARDQAQAALSQALAQKASASRSHQSDLKALKLERQLTAMAEDNANRLEKLFKQSLASQAQLDEARQQLARQRLNLEARQLAVSDYRNTVERLDAEITRSQAARDQAELDLERSRVTAPFSGRITTLHVATGERVRPGEPLVSLYAESGVEIRAQIPQRYLPQVRAGLARGALPGQVDIEGQTASLLLERLAGEVSRGQGGVDGLFRLQGDGLVPELGRPMELRLDLPAEENLVAVPAAALHGLNRLYRVDSEQRLDAVEVDRIGEWTDADGNRRILVRGDLAPGDPVMVTQLPGAIDGLRVNPVNQGPTPVPDSAEPSDAADAEPTAA